MTDPATFTVPLAGRDILFRQPIPGQLIILRRKLLRLKQQAEGVTDDNKRLELANQLIITALDMAESLIIDPADAEFLEEAMLKGHVGHEEVMAVIGMRATPEPEAKKATKKAAKAPAKAVANRGRTRR